MHTRRSSARVAAKKSSAKKTTPKKAAPSKSPAKKAATKKSPAKKVTTPTKSTPKKVAPKKAAPKKSPAKKAVPKPAAPTKTRPTKATVARKSSATAATSTTTTTPTGTSPAVTTSGTPTGEAKATGTPTRRGKSRTKAAKPAKQTGGSVTMPAALFIKAVKATALAAGKDATLPTLTGIKIEVDKKQVRFISTDRYRLAVVRWNNVAGEEMAGGTTSGTSKECSVLIDAKDLLRFVRGIKLVPVRYGTPKEAITVTFDGERTVVVTFADKDGQTSATFNPIDGDFPKWGPLFPTDTFEHGAARWAVNPQYLSDACTAATTISERNTPLRIEARAANRPAVLKAGSEGDGFWLEWLAMPVRLAG
jgi:hypothetical protein